MCIPKKYVYKPHFIINEMPGLLDAKCIISSSYFNTLNGNPFCTECYVIKNFFQAKLCMFHGFADGKNRPLYCTLCMEDMLTYQPIYTCFVCINTYISIMRELRNRGITRNQIVEPFIYNCVNKRSVFLKLTDEYGNTYEIDI